MSYSYPFVLVRNALCSDRNRLLHIENSSRHQEGQETDDNEANKENDAHASADCFDGFFDPLVAQSVQCDVEIAVSRIGSQIIDDFHVGKLVICLEQGVTNV